MHYNPQGYNNFYPPHPHPEILYHHYPHFCHHGPHFHIHGHGPHGHSPHIFHPHFANFFPHFIPHGFPIQWPNYFPPFIPSHNDYQPFNQNDNNNKYSGEYYPQYDNEDNHHDFDNTNKNEGINSDKINNNSKDDFNSKESELKNEENNSESNNINNSIKNSIEDNDNDFRLLKDSENISIQDQLNYSDLDDILKSSNNDQNQIILESNHEHPLNYINKLKSSCTICQQKHENYKGYKCDQCPLILCLNCAERVFYGNKKSTIHHHPLLLKYKNEWKCNICDILFKNTSAFFCDQCGFNVCTFCLIS